MKKILTLVFFVKDDQILLGLKKRGFGEGRWNGFGGKVEKSEIIENGATREVQEEAGILVSKLEKRAILTFTFETNKDTLEVHTFEAKEWEGEPKETEEMRPCWFPLTKIPYESMWSDDKHWLPLILEGKNVIGDFHFDAQDEVLHHNLDIVESL